MRLALAIILVGLSLPVQAQEREWSIDTNGENEAYMTYGVPETEDIGLSLWCKIGSKNLNLYVPQSGWQTGTAKFVDVKIAADPVQINIKGKLQEDPTRDSASVEAKIELASPLVTALPDAQHIDIDTGKHKIITPLYDAPVSSLLRMCKGE
jgi:hypothetical protein